MKADEHTATLDLARAFAAAVVEELWAEIVAEADAEREATRPVDDQPA
ncbi:MAG: hypothetical protein JSR73_12130 [Proteobacteria bacterium]|nr:hypothetical protein [Pseudomonadota bacterium]